MADLMELQQILGVSFSNPSLLTQALIHSSYANENPGIDPACNERLEFLGDAILGVVIAEKLYQLLPDAAEGEMTRLRATLVRRKTLSQLAAGIGLHKYLYLGKGEEESGGRQKASNLAGAMEAVIAAVFLDRGWDSARDFVLRLFQAHLDQTRSTGPAGNCRN